MNNPRAPLKIWRGILLLGTTMFVVILDQLTKDWVRNNVIRGQSIPDEGFLRLTHVTNTGSAFGMLQGQTVFLTMVSFITIIVIAVYLLNGRSEKNFVLQYSLTLALGGAIGNTFDRIVFGWVTDFIDVQIWGDYHFPAFNLADSAISMGLLLLLATVIWTRRTQLSEEVEG